MAAASEGSAATDNPHYDAAAVMVFNRKASFFLDLGSEGATPAQVAISEAKPDPSEPEASQAATFQIGVGSSTTAAAEATPASPAPAGTAPTTAEAIAAELRAAQEALPPPSNVTFAPDCLNPANALPSRRRLAGANLAGYKAMASGMFRN
ncbi:MAG: hypothetical protein NTZ23_10100 [Cyanobium sp. LacPavin_0920_WC12_MAG_63_22]|nr:hypothetical protein [Cyanobium sp. LacPavin_0920_WC12_MAG_63_22]